MAKTKPAAGEKPERLKKKKSKAPEPLSAPSAEAQDSAPDKPAKAAKKKAGGSGIRPLALILPVAAAALLLAVSLVIHYGFFDVVGLGKAAPETELTDWRFVWGASSEDIGGEITTWKQANGSRRVKKLDRDHPYLRMTMALDPDQQDRDLTIETGYHPLKVELNGEELYNNGYGTEAYTGNRYNAVRIPASAGVQQVDVYLYAPMSLELTTLLTPSERVTGVPDPLLYLGEILGAAVMLIGLLLMVVSLLIALKGRNLGRMALLGLTVLTAGAALGLSCLSGQSMAVNSPQFYNLQLVFNILLAELVALSGYVCFSIKPHLGVALGGTALMAASLGMLFVTDPVWIFILTMGVTALLIGAMAFVLMGYCGRVEQRMPLAKLSLTVFLYMTMVNLYNLFCAATGASRLSYYLDAVAVTVYGVAVFCVFFRQAVHVNVRLRERDRQTQRDSVWINNIAAVLSDLFLQKTHEEFLEKSIQGLSGLIQNDISRAVEDTDSAGLRDDGGVRACGALLEDGGFREVCNVGGVERCQYDAVAAIYQENPPRRLHFASTYLDMLFVVDGRVSAVIHFENIRSGLSNRFQNVIVSAHSSMETAYANLNLKNDMVVTQENVFVALAETVECMTGDTKQHLYAVSDITRILCEQMGFTPHETQIISAAAKVHDVGKVAIPDSIINSPNPLTPDELDLVKTHVLYGYNILSKSPGEFVEAAAVIAQQHHERYDGSGYLGLQGENIHIYARIVAVADVFDALVRKRSYKEPWPVEQACDYIRERAGTEFDPRVVEAFCACADRIIQAEKLINQTVEE